MLPFTTLLSNYRLGDQSGGPENPQTLLDSCYFLPPVCDWKSLPQLTVPIFRDSWRRTSFSPVMTSCCLQGEKEDGMHKVFLFRRRQQLLCWTGTQ
ncbi:hypothetical protein PAMP_009831 [Pampus punctatissimus]